MAGRGPLPHPYARGLVGPGPGIRPEPFAPVLGPLIGPHPLDLLPPEVLEHKLALQNAEVQKLAAENQRFAQANAILRQDREALDVEKQRMQARMGAFESDMEQQIRSILDKNTKMEADVQANEIIKVELQQGRADAQNLLASRQELTAQVQQLGQELQRASAEVQQFPAMHAEVDNLRKEVQRARAAYEYEKAANHAQAEQNQVMEKNLLSMAREVEKLRAELANADMRGREVQFGAGYGSHDSSYTAGHNMYGDGYGIPQIPASVDNAAAPYSSRGPATSEVAATYAGRVGPGVTETSIPYAGRGGPAASENASAYAARGGPGWSGYDVSRGGGGGGGGGHIRR